MDIRSTWGITPMYLKMLRSTAVRYLKSSARNRALRQGVQNILVTYSPSALHKRAAMRDEWGFAPEGYAVSVTNDCNLNPPCRYCYHRAGGVLKDKIVNIDLDKLGIIFDEMKQLLGIRFVTLTGGETTLCLREIAVRWPDITFFAYTNGKLLNAQFCQELKELGNVVIALTIIGREATHEIIRSENYADVMAAVENLRQSSLVWGFSITESRVNYHEIVKDDLLGFLLQFKPFFFRMIPFMPVGREQYDSALKPEEYARIAEVIQVRKKSGVPIHDYINDPTLGYSCMAGGVGNFLVTERLSLSPCIFMGTFTSPLVFKDGKSNLVEVLREHPYFTRARDVAVRFPRCIILENSNWREEIVL